MALAAAALALAVACLAAVGGGLVPTPGGEGASWEEGGLGQAAPERGAAQPAAGAAERHSASTLEDEASELLSAYQSQGRTALVRSGYLDLLGNVWSCVVQGDGWVDLCVVRRGEEAGCDVKVTRLQADAWREELL